MTPAGEPLSQEPSDAELIRRTRDGDADAYGELYARHAEAATRVASRLTAGTPVAADDVVSDAFLGVLSAIRSGHGPEESFRAYLYTAVRNGAAGLRERESRAVAVEDPAVYEKPEPAPDPAVTAFESEVVQRAFASLPERWQAVLWYHEVEAMRPAEISPLLGLSANGVSALLLRAREGLREAYLVAHLGALDPARTECVWTAARLGAEARGSLSRRDRRRLGVHLAECADCRAMAAEAAEVNRGLQLIIAPFILGGSAAALAASRRTARDSGESARGQGGAPDARGLSSATSGSVPTAGVVAGLVTAGVVVVAIVALAIAGALGSASGEDAAVGPETGSPGISDPDEGPEETAAPVADDTAPPLPPPVPPRRPDPAPAPGVEPPASEPTQPEDPPVTMAQSVITGTVTVVDRDHPSLALDGPIEQASVTWISDEELAADMIFFEMPTGEYALDADTTQVQTLPDGSVRYVSTADATAIVTAFSTSEWAVDEAIGVVGWRIEIVQTGADPGGVRLDGPVELAAGQQVSLTLIAPGSGAAYITTLDGSVPESSVVDGVLSIRSLVPVTILEVIVVFGP